MAKERLVDVKAGAKVLHTFPVKVAGHADERDEDAFKEKALQAAANAKLIPDASLEDLSADLHVSRSGPLEPSPDPLGVLAETPEGLEQAVRERSYLLWEQAGRPDGRSLDFWNEAREQHLRERAYALWEREGCPHGQADEHWYRMIDFEAR